MQILKVHKAHRVTTGNGFHCMQLYFIVTDGPTASSYQKVNYCKSHVKLILV